MPPVRSKPWVYVSSVFIPVCLSDRVLRLPGMMNSCLCQLNLVRCLDFSQKKRTQLIPEELSSDSIFTFPMLQESLPSGYPQ